MLEIWENQGVPKHKQATNEPNKHRERKYECCLCVGFPICPSDNNHFTGDRSLIAMERSVKQIMNNSKTGNWKLYRANFASQVITINGARSAWHFSRPVYQSAGCDVDVGVCVCDRLLGAPHLFQSPVELCRPEGVQLNEVSPQQKHQTAVVHVQGVMMPVHLCKKKNTEKAYCICNVNEDTQEITYTGCQSWNLTLSKDLHL